MPTSSLDDRILTVAISSRALFDLEDSNRVYVEQGLEAYRKYQIAHEDEPLEPGEAYPFVRKLLNINVLLERARVEVILLSRNSADTGLRIFNSIKSHGLNISRAAFCGGERPYRYVQAFKCDLFLSTDSDDVVHALDNRVAAATLLSSRSPGNPSEELRIAFDGDSVLFSDEADQVFRRDGLDAFAATEQAAAARPLAGGPFKDFLAGLHRLQTEFDGRPCPIRTALVTARAAPAHERVIRTLRAWDVRLDECLFLGGADKTQFLRAFGADVFFDDQAQNCERALGHVASGHVPRSTA
jgi:5'-nucleotidase